MSHAWRTKRRSIGIAVLLFLLLFAFLIAGCGQTTSNKASHVKNREKSYIMGEVIEITKASSTETAKGTLCTVDIEGSRSQAIPEALVTVTKDTKIIDEHGGSGPTATFDTIKQMQTVEAWFDILSSAPNPWYAKATKIVICP
jgi:hypothetical protein